MWDDEKYINKFTINGVFFLVSEIWHKWSRLHKDATQKIAIMKAQT